MTGLTFLSTELLGKRLELLTQMVPQATTVAYLSGPSSSLLFEEDMGEILKAAQALGRELIVVGVRSPLDFETPFATFIQREARALIVGAFPWLFERRDRIHDAHEICERYRLPGKARVCRLVERRPGSARCYLQGLAARVCFSRHFGPGPRM